jgi:transposase-like protein
MQILHPFTGSIQQYFEEVSDPDRYRPDHCPQCQAKPPLTAHGFYRRIVEDVEFDGDIPVRRYLCHSCKRTVSLLPQFALPFLRFSIPVISVFLIARLLNGYTLKASAQAAAQPAMPYQRGQLWSHRFRKQAESLCAALATLTAPQAASNFVTRALHMLQTVGWTPAHRFLFSQLRAHLLGWPPFLAPDGRLATLRPALLPT